MISRLDGTLYLDSSWRHKNENRAPLTFVTTTNDAGHMVPVAAYLSVDATASSYRFLLDALTKEVLNEAKKICAEASNPDDGTEDDISEWNKLDRILLRNAQRLIQEGSWWPQNVMIDKMTSARPN